MSKDINDLIPNIPIRTNPEQAEITLYEDFKILFDLLKNGATGSFTSGIHTLTITKGIITNIT